jgi:hypothetical protein
MSRLIDYTYFQSGMCVIPTYDATSDVGVAQIAELNAIIDKVQRRILREYLGDDLYDAFMTGLGTVPIPTKWSTLKAAIVDSTNKESFLKYFVYIEYKKHSNSISGQVGDLKPQEANIAMWEDWAKNSNLWNIGVDLFDEFVDWLEDNYVTQDYDMTDIGSAPEKINRLGI